MAGSAVLAGLLLTSHVSGQIQMPEPASLQEALQIWKGWGNRPSIWKRFMGYRAMAMTRTKEGRKLLTSLYKRPGEHPEANQTLIARLMRKHYAGPDDWEDLEKLLERNDKDANWWLWHELMAMRAERGRTEDVLNAIRNEKLEPAIRAAAVHALGANPKAFGIETILNEVPTVCLAFESRDEHEMALMTEAPLALWRQLGMNPDAPEVREALRPWVAMLDDDAVPMRRKIVISRALADILKQPNLGLKSGPWTTLLDTPVQTEEGGDKPKKFQRFSTAGTQAGFFGINEISKRVVFVIDASDSMLKPITEREKTWLKPVSGKAASGEDEEEGGDGQPSAEERAIENLLPWDEIDNRWEATIEFVRLACERMAPEQGFAIVLFGDEAETLSTTPGIMPADQRLVAAAIQELRDIKIGAPSNDPRRPRPYGTLKGKTNLHGGIDLAYRMRWKKGPLRDEAGNDPDVFEGGADTIFVLSDGDPNWDNLAEDDKTDEGDMAADIETGKGRTKTQRGTFPGPFRYMEWMMWDLQRLQMLRNARIHLVGFGEADRKTLDAIAVVSGGRTLMVGQQ